MGHLAKSKNLTEPRVCPSCGKAFIWFTKNPLSCPYCGYLSHENRGEKRLASDKGFSLTVGGKSCPANLIDYSMSGVRLSCPERMSMDSLVSIDIDELDIHRSARAVWTVALTPGLAITGLKFT